MVRTLDFILITVGTHVADPHILQGLRRNIVRWFEIPVGIFSKDDDADDDSHGLWRENLFIFSSNHITNHN